MQKSAPNPYSKSGGGTHAQTLEKGKGRMGIFHK